MYKDHFQLARNPFDITPDPDCFVPTKGHNEALAALYYGVRRHKGMVVVTGEVGTGKTLVLRCLLGLFKESQDVAYAYLFNGRLTPTEFLQYIVSDFGLPSAGKNKAELLFDLSQFLVSRGLNKLTTVLIVDEAHHLSAEILEEIRLLSNLETAEDKLLQIVLSGQPELDLKLDSFGLRQLKQRIALRAQLDPLDLDKTRDYIERRLKIAGASWRSGLLFPDQTISHVYRHSRGIPRLINTICENALVTAYARRLPSVTPEIIEEIAIDLRLDVVTSLEEQITENHTDRDVQRAIQVILDLYASRRRPAGSNSGMGMPASAVVSDR
jgi:general secretion pathway protein A